MQNLIEVCFFQSGQLEELLHIDDEQETLSTLKTKLDSYTSDKVYVTGLMPLLDTWRSTTNGYKNRPSTATFYQNPVVTNPGTYLGDLNDRTD